MPHIIAVADNRAASVPPVWTAVWRDQGARLGVLAAALAVLTAIVLAQGRLARRPKLLARIRIGFLAFTLVWIGWFAGAQLSVSHLLSLARAPFEAGHLSALMFDPLILLLIGFVGLSLLLLGRGVFCGWLCPFGALQELLNKAARRFGVTQWRVPVGLNERLWAVKYLVLILLLGAAFADRSFAARAVEIEPFTTSILLGFVRYWPYVAFAVALLAIGLVVERFYCRFLCPLGAGLAILGRWRMVSWLKRRPECGNSCATCQGLCPVQAIGDDGAINLNECYQCLSCQVAYNDNHVCPPLIARRERLERLSGGGAYERKRAAAPAVQ